MPSELKRGAIRTLSNYSRSFLQLIVGILFVPIFLLGVGDEGFGLFGLLVSTIGIAEIVDGVVRDSMNRELGAAYHSTAPNAFAEAYNSAIVLCIGLALVVTGLFAALYAVLPLLNIPDELLHAAKVVLACKFVLSILTVMLGPQFNMYMVTERMVLFNIWLLAKRMCFFVAAVVLFVFLGMRDPANGLIAFAYVSVGLQLLVLLIAVGVMVWLEPRLIPAPSHTSWRGLKRIVSTAGWNAAVSASLNMQTFVTNILMNLWFGLIGNAAFYLAIRLAGYVRMIAFANTQGLDVVSARLSTTASVSRVAEVMRHSARMHAMAAIPAGMIVMFLADPLMHLWVARATEDPNTVAMAIVLSKVLVIGMTARGISDCWLRMLYGAGFIRAYAPLVILGGILNPITAIALILLLPASIGYLGPALAYTGILLLVNFSIIPFVTARCLSISVGEVMLPLLRPAIVTTIASPILLLPFLLSTPHSPIFVAAAVGMFGTATFALAWYFVLDHVDRDRLAGAIRRRLGRAPGARATDATIAS